jgi:hypothetical protein
MSASLKQSKRKGKPRIVRFPGIIADARALGVNRATLYRVLTGEWTHLGGLRRRYDALKAQQGEELSASFICPLRTKPTLSIVAAPPKVTA